MSNKDNIKKIRAYKVSGEVIQKCYFLKRYGKNEKYLLER